MTKGVQATRPKFFRRNRFNRSWAPNLISGMTPKWKVHSKYSCLEKRIRDNISTDGGNRASKTQAKLDNFTSASHFFRFFKFPPRARGRWHCTTLATLKKREFTFQAMFSPRLPLWYLGPSPHTSVFVWKRRFFSPVWLTENAFF